MSLEPDAPETATQVDHRVPAALRGVLALLALLMRLRRVGPQMLLKPTSGGMSRLLRARAAEWASA